MAKYAWIALVAMCAISYTYTRVQAHAEAAEFRLATAQLVAPQVMAQARQDVLAGRLVGAKHEWAWFAKAHVGLGDLNDR